MEPSDRFDKYQFSYQERKEIIDCVKSYFALSREERIQRRHLDSEPEPEQQGWLDRWRAKKNFEHLKIRVESWAEDLSDTDLTEMERIYLDPNFYQLLPFRSNRTYTKEVMDKFLQSGSEYEPISERTRSKTFNGYPRTNEFYESSNQGTSSSRLIREAVGSEEAISIEEAAGTEEAEGTEGAADTEEVDDTEEAANIEEATRTKEVTRPHPRTEKTTSTKAASTSYRQNVRFERQTPQETSDDDSGVFSRLRSRLVDSLENSSNSSSSSNSWTSSSSDLNQKANGSSNANGSKQSSLKRNNSKDNSSKANGSPRRTLMMKEGSNQEMNSNQRTRSVDKALANREVSLIKHRLVKKKLWLNEQAMLSDMNANYLNELNSLNDFSDDEPDYENSNEKSNQFDGPVTSMLKSIRRTSNRVKNNISNTTVTTARTTSTSRPRRPAKRKAKENLRQSPNNLKVTFASDSLLDFSDLDEIDAESDLKESIHELHPLKAPTKQLYLFVALVFLSIFTFKFINSQ